jgi:superfamily II DNA or RNA helicase
MVELLTDDLVQHTVGTDAFLRGRDYASAGNVSAVAVSDVERFVVATVQGNRPAPYQTIVRIEEGSGGRVNVRGVCTCPVAVSCKHVAAAMITARRAASVAQPTTPSSAGWEEPLNALVSAEAEQSRPGSPMALQFEVLDAPRPGTPPRTRFAYSRGEPTAPRRRTRIRPLVPGRSGAWVRTGVSWRDLAYDVWNPRVPAHREALRELYSAHRSGSHGYSYAEVAVYLDEFGSSLWSLLSQARDAGVAFVPAKATLGPVELAAKPATVALDLSRPTESAPARLRPVVTLEGAAVAADAVQLLGRPPHGLLLDWSTYTDGRSHGLTLAPLSEPLSEAVGQLLSTGRSISIPGEDLARFLRDYYPRLRRSVTVVSSDDSVEFPTIRPPRLALSVTHLPQHQVDLDWSFTYAVGGSTTRIGLSDASALPGLRDPKAERAALDSLELPDNRLPQLRAMVNGSRRLAPSVRLAGLDAVYFMSKLLPLLTAGSVVDVEVVGSAPDYRQSESPPLVRVSATEAPGSSDWFDLAVTVSVDDEEIPFQSLFAALALGDTHLILDSGTFFSIERPEYDELRRLIDEARGLQDKESDGLRLSTYQAGLWEDFTRLGVVEAQSERWARTVKGLLDLDQIPQPELPSGLLATLRPYQREGYSWLSFLRDHGLGGILADDMGLGKTVQALALVSAAVEQDPLAAPFLVVAPTSVVHNWAVEAERFAPGLDVVCLGETEARGGMGLAERVKGAHLVVTSYALFRIDFDAYAAVAWSGLVLDEAQIVKNHQAKTYQCVRRLEAPFKLAITGTPLENNLMDLWSLLSIVAPGLFPSPQRFAELYRKPIERGTDPELLGRLRRRIRPLMLRRTKEQVAAELPPKQEQVLEVTLQPRHHKIYQTHLQRERQKVLGLIGDMDRNRFAIFRSLTLLRQLSLAPSLVDAGYSNVRSSKVDAFYGQLDEVVREGHRSLVFSQFTGFLRLVRERLDAEGIGYCYLDGRTRKRAEQVDAFKRGDAPVFLISLKAGGFGLNLTEADYCFVLDPWWNPAVEAQAVDRAHRIGQDKTVMVYRLVALDTIEEKVMELKARKQDLFDKVMDDDALLSAPLTADDVKGLLGL